MFIDVLESSTVILHNFTAQLIWQELFEIMSAEDVFQLRIVNSNGQVTTLCEKEEDQ
jgi:hypothetical protein